MNSMAAVCITDYIKPLYFKNKKKKLDEKRAGTISKILALVFGFASFGLAYACKYFGEAILQLALSIFGLLGGPILGVISLGMFVPHANSIVTQILMNFISFKLKR